MPTMKPLRIGLVGCGFMGRAHSNAYRQVPRFFDSGYEPQLTVVCGRDRAKTEEFAKRWGYLAAVTGWRDLVSRQDIDLIDIASPNDTHAEIALAAAKAGKIVLCEKPLGRSLEEARAMVEAVESARVPNMVWYNYRRVPAITLAKRTIEDGALGRVFHYRAKFLQDWTISGDVPVGGRALWRLDAKTAGSGVTGDLLAHCIDTAIWLNGPITKVCAMSETFIKRRQNSATGEPVEISIDDASAFLARFGNGSLGTFEATRYARGHKAFYTFEINGEKGSLSWSLEDLHRLEYFNYQEPSHLRGWRSIHVSESEHPYMKSWWVPGLQIGYEHTFIHQVADFLHALDQGETPRPTFRDALSAEQVVDAVLESAKSERWVECSLETTGEKIQN